MNYVVFGDIVEANGKTIRENNRAIPHNLPLGAVVEVDFDHPRTTHDGIPIGYSGKATLYVVAHTRDCDGSTLYWVASEPIGAPPSDSPNYYDQLMRWRLFVDFYLKSYPEDALRDTGRRAERFYDSFRDFARMLRGE